MSAAKRVPRPFTHKSSKNKHKSHQQQNDSVVAGVASDQPAKSEKEEEERRLLAQLDQTPPALAPPAVNQESRAPALRTSGNPSAETNTGSSDVGEGKRFLEFCACILSLSTQSCHSLR